MARLVKDYIEIRDHLSLDVLIAELSAVRDALNDSAQPQVRLRGDDFFGHHVAISFFRPQTADEAACEARYQLRLRAAA